MSGAFFAFPEKMFGCEKNLTRKLEAFKIINEMNFA